jgi:conjugative transfer pilus assembly protein TraH
MRAPKHLLKSGLLAASVSVAVLMAPAANASLAQELNSMFSEMSNHTAPGVHQSQRRGVVFGGRMTTKNRIINQNVVSFIPPHIKAGCGGIDMFGGSFSFINSEQLVQLMRAVAQNAIGYAFQLALDAVCAPCSKHIAFLQDTISKLNQHLGNSCQLAQGLVDTGLRALTETQRKDEENKATDTGVSTDSLWSRIKESAKNLKKDKPAEYQKLIGNVTWNELQKNRVSNWFRHGDTDLMEAMLSVAGSIIVGDLIDVPNPSPGSEGGKTNKITTLDGYVLTLQELAFGSDSGRVVRLYDCSSNRTSCAGSDGATPPTIKEVHNFEGVEMKIRNALLGTASNTGLIAKYARPELAISARFSSAEEAFLAGLPAGLGGMLRNLAPLSEDSARQFVEQNSAVIAVEMTYELVNELLRAVTVAVASSDSAYAAKASEVFRDSGQRLINERMVLVQRFGSLSDVVSQYQTYIALQQKQRYMYSTITNDGKK